MLYDRAKLEPVEELTVLSLIDNYFEACCHQAKNTDAIPKPVASGFFEQ